MEFPALIDTGSDKTVSYMQPFGNFLGVSADQFEGEPDRLSGLVGESNAWAKHIDLWIGEHRLNVPIFWLLNKFDVHSNYPFILGRHIVFDYFDVVFCQQDKKVYFYPRKE